MFFTKFSIINVRLTESFVWYRNYFHTGTVSCWSKKFKFILYSASKQTVRNSFHHFLYYRTLTTACFSYFSNTHVLFLQNLKNVHRVGLACEDWRIKADRRITLTIIYSYVVNQKYTLEKYAHFTCVLILHNNSGNIPSILNMEKCKK